VSALFAYPRSFAAGWRNIAFNAPRVGRDGKMGVCIFHFDHCFCRLGILFDRKFFGPSVLPPSPGVSARICLGWTFVTVLGELSFPCVWACVKSSMFSYLLSDGASGGTCPVSDQAIVATL
jgi:hypothetical protein